MQKISFTPFFLHETLHFTESSNLTLQFESIFAYNLTARIWPYTGFAQKY